VTIEKCTTRAKAMGGRVGTAKSDDGQINLKLDRPVEMGGKGNGTRIPENVAIDSAVSFGPSKRKSGRISIAVAMLISLPGIEQATAEELVHRAPIKWARIPMQRGAISTCY
jgi:osmotically inducible protein OsmC